MQAGVRLLCPSCRQPRLPTSMTMTLRRQIVPPEGPLVVVDLQVMDSPPASRPKGLAC